MKEVNVSIWSLNVRGLNEQKKRRSVFRFLKQNKVDICLLQETYSSEKTKDIWRNEWGGNIYWCHGATNSRGVAILVRPKVDFKCEKEDRDDSGRFLAIKALIQDQAFTIINVYAPNKEEHQVHFFHYVRNFMNRECIQNQHSNIIMGGDFNFIMDPNMDRKSDSNFKCTPHYSSVRNTLNEISESFDISDVWRRKNPNLRRFTWRRHHPQVKSRLDYWLVSNNLYDCIDKTDIEPSIKSDHSAISLTLKGSLENARGRGYWKLNNTFLQEEAFIAGLIRNKDGWTQESGAIEDPRIKWEFIKYKIRHFASDYGKKKAKERHTREKELYAKLKELEAREDSSDETNREINHLKTEIETIDEEKVRGLILRSGATWHEQGEKSNSYFLRLESRNKVLKTINKLEDENGETVTDQKQILQMQADFYERLYQSKTEKSPENIMSYLSDIDMETLPENDKASLEEDITMEECAKVIRTFPKSKAPGNDGLTIEFYQKFWPIFGRFLIESINYTFAHGELSSSQKQAVITLLDKGKDRTKLKNWRPISLLNVDYKIISKCLATRIRKVISGLIHHNQVGYVKNRNIQDNIRAIADVLEYTKRANKQGILLCIDFEKAFDSLEWGFMNAILDKLNFGPVFKKWVNILYTSISSCVTNNGHTSNYFSLQRGVRQGDPLSPYLFILAVEVLAQKIRQNERIKGIRIGGDELKVLQYADDTTALIENVNSAKILLETVKEFGLYSGLHINTDKTEAMWLGCNRESNSKPLGITWKPNGIKITGVYFSYNQLEGNILNFEQKLAKANNILKMWNQRNLTMIGRIQIIKTFIISQFTYVTSAIDMPEVYAKELEKMVWKFIWKGKKEKLKRSLLCQPVLKGGLNAPDIRKIMMSYKLKWIQKYVGTLNHVWKNTCNWFMDNADISLTVLLQSNFKLSTQAESALPEFYVKMLRFWADMGNTKGGKKNFLWYNKDIVIGNKSVYYESFNKFGICTKMDLYDENGQLIPFQQWIQKGLKHRDFLRWCGLVRQCKIDPSIVKNDVGTSSELVVKLHQGTKCLNKTSTKEVYQELLTQQSNFVNIPRISGKLEEREVNWETVYRRMYLSEDTKTREFQYKFLNDILATNFWLYKWKIKETDRCTFCNVECETIQHLFWECIHVKELWNSIQHWYKNISGKEITMNMDLVMLGSEDTLIHSIVMVTKQVIYSNKYAEKLPTINQVKLNLERVMKMEVYNSTSIPRQGRAIEKWAPLM